MWWQKMSLLPNKNYNALISAADKSVIKICSYKKMRKLHDQASFRFL